VLTRITEDIGKETTDVQTVTTTIRVPPKLMDAVRKQATKERRTISSLMAWALESYLAEAGAPDPYKPRKKATT
jgi:hypothetical protein